MERESTPDEIKELTPEQFRAWLEGKDKGETVGQAAYARECPLACFLQASGYLTASVWDDIVYINPVMKPPTPLWARDFIKKIDTKEEGFTYAVRAETALYFLDEALKREQ